MLANRYALVMSDGFSFSGVQSALRLKTALDDVTKRASGADLFEHETNTAAKEVLSPAANPIRNALRLESSDFKKIEIGDLVELKQPSGDIKFGLVKNKQSHDHLVELSPISPTQASTIQHNFPNTHYLVVSKFKPGSDSQKGWFGWDFSRIETLIAAFTDYFLALMEKIVGKQLSRSELESKGLALTIASLTIFSLVFWVYTLLQQY
jgi:hypothetical protein